MSSDSLQLREHLLEVSRQLSQLGLNRGSAGNCSVRVPGVPEHFLITPSAVPAEQLTAEGMVPMHLDGRALGLGKPSSEWRFHRDIYRARSEVSAVVHVHSPAATALACLRRDVPPFHYMVAVAGGSTIRCAPYALFGTQALSDAALAALQDRKACLMANHGMIATGSSLSETLALTIEVESLCEQYLRALNVGEPVLLSEQEMAEVFEQFKDYRRPSGQPKP